MVFGDYVFIRYLFDGDWKKVLESFGYIFIVLYEWATICLFVLVTFLSSISLQVIIEEVKNPLPLIANGAKTQLMKWGQNYSHIFVLNQHINKCFGLFLLTFILKQMITIQDLIFVINDHLSSKDSSEFPYLLFLTLLNYSLPCLMICYASQNMKNKVFGNITLTNELLTWHVKCFFARSQIWSES